MNNIKIKHEKDLHLFHQASNIPICVFDNTPKALLRYPLIDTMECSPVTMNQCCQILNESPDELPIIYSSDSCFAALLKLDEHTNIMFGPVSSIPLSFQEFYNTGNNCIDSDDLTHLYRVIQQSPHISLSHFARNIALFMKLIFQKDISTQEILANHIILPAKNLSSPPDKISEPHYLSVSEAITFQKKILYHIRQGNMTEIKEMFSESLFFTNLEHVPTSITDYKKMFFIYATLCCITTIEEGLDLHIGFPIFDTYTSKIPALTTLADLEKLCMNISVDYCRQIMDLHQLQSESPVVTQCLQYIQNHLYTKITLKDLAKHCNLSPRTITRHFSEYHHISVSEYILLCKLKEAAFLLTHSTFSLAEISHHLAFSSQSHFSVAFKKKYLYTPQQYREKHQK